MKRTAGTVRRTHGVVAASVGTDRVGRHGSRRSARIASVAQVLTIARPCITTTDSDGRSCSTFVEKNMNGAFCTLLVCVLSFATPHPAVDDDPAKTGRTVALEKCDRLFDGQKYDEAHRLAESLLRQNPNDAEILWRLSNYTINDGDAEGDRERKERLYRKAVDYAERAVQSDNNNAFAHAYVAAACGSYAMFAGGKEKVKLANRIRDELDIALKLDPDNQVAHTIYGTWHREVAEVSWIERQLANVFLGSMPDGSIERSISHLKKAVKVAPNVLRHRFELGRSYIAAGREKEAAESYRAALKCPDGWKVDPRRRARMNKWLSENG